MSQAGVIMLPDGTIQREANLIEDIQNENFTSNLVLNGNTGQINALKGSIGGFKIEGGKLTTTGAGLSSVAGVGKDNPAFWAGGTYNQAIGGAAKAIIRHDGTSKFTDTEISGRISTPFVYKEASEIDGTILDFGDTFNLMVSSNYPHTTTIYLPKEQKYNGTECRIFNSGISNIKVGIVGGMYFEGVGTVDLPSIYTIPGRHIGIFIAVGAFNSGVAWVCTNPERLIPSYTVE